MSPPNLRQLRSVLASRRLLQTPTHGLPHWDRVALIGARMAEQSQADPLVVQLFAYFHDSCRESDGHDPDHGRRAAKLALDWHGTQFECAQPQLDLLVQACAGHADGQTSANATIGTCWDADRLDLPRVGVMPRTSMLSTAAARDKSLLQWVLSLER